MTTPTKPMYLYQNPMFMLTVSTVLIVENGVVVVKENTQESTIKFPGGIVKASLETVQFAAVRHIKEQVGITLSKNLLIPVDFRSDPNRSEDGNVVDIGFVSILDDIAPDHLFSNELVKWIEVDFEKKELINNSRFYMDHDVLLHRAIDVALMAKN